VHHSRKELAARIAVVLVALGVIVLLASLSGGPTRSLSCAQGFVDTAGHCLLERPAKR